MLIPSHAGMDTTEDIMEKLRRRVRDEGCRGEEQLRKMLASILTDTMDAGDNALHLEHKTVRHSRCRRQRCRQNDDHRQTRLPADGGRKIRSSSRGRHLPRRRCRTAHRVGRSRGMRYRAPRGRATPPPSCSTRFAAAKARGRDVIIVDTAGRLHNKANLMK